MKTIKLNTNPILYNIENENKIYIKIIFFRDINLKDKDRFYDRLLTRMLNCSSKKYNTIESFNKILESNYLLNYRVNCISTINKKALEFNLTLPKEGLIEDFDLDKAFSLLHEFIFNPYIEDNHFNKERFALEKEYILGRIKDEYLSIYDEAIEEFNLFIDPKEKYHLSKKTCKKLINEVNEYNLYNHYENVIRNNNYYTYIYGAIDNNRILNLYNKYFKQPYHEAIIHSKTTYLFPYTNYEEKVRITKYNQSVLSQNYKVENITNKDIRTLRMLYYFLSSKENNLIFNKLRNEHNLIYESYVEQHIQFGYLNIEVYLDKKDKETIKKLIEETIYSIKDEKVFNRCKSNLITSLKYDLLDSMDDNLFEFYQKLNKDLKYKDTLKQITISMKKITYNEMSSFLNRFKLSKELFLEGGNNGKDN